MNSFFEQVLNFPGIIQGIIGSALFALLLFLGQKVTNWGAQKASNYSKKIKEQNLLILWSKYSMLNENDKENGEKATAYQTALIYSSLRELLKGAIWILLGLILEEFWGVLSSVGYLGGMYYLFQALIRVQRVDTDLDIKEKLTEIDKSLKEFELNKAKHSDA